MRKNNGITLIALVVTVILLLILTSVSINLIIGENGLLKRAESTEEKQRELQARQKLDLALLDAKKDKNANDEFNNNEYLDEFLRKKGITVSGDTAIVDGFAFLIDRDELKILDKLDDSEIEIPVSINTKITTEVKSYLGKNDNDKYEASVLVKFENEEGFQNIVITNPDGTTVEITEEEAIVGKTITMELDTEYPVTITTKTGTIENTKIVEASEEIIHNVEELVAFRVKVNSGLTYAGKTVKLAEDLDLSSICGETVGNWVPIGASTYQFKGSFDGQNHTISNLYYSYATAGTYVGLFGYATGGTIKNLTLEGTINANITTYVARYLGGFVGYGYSVTLENLVNNCNIKFSNNSYITCVGGIAGRGYGTIKDCINNATITGYGESVGGITGKGGRVTNCINTGNVTNQKGKYTGGIVGQTEAGISQSYNTGTIDTTNNTGTVGGIAGYNNQSITECYNAGPVYGRTTSTNATTSHVGGISGNQISFISNCYNTGYVAGGYVGGISGMTQSTIMNCYNVGNIYGTSTGANAGGIGGHVMTTGRLTNCYSLSTISVSRSGTSRTSTLYGSTLGLITGFGGYTSTNVSGCNTVSDTDLKVYANILNTNSFVNDPDGGYPIFKWQLPETEQ